MTALAWAAIACLLFAFAAIPTWDWWRGLDDRIDRMVADVLAVEAGDWGEPTRVEVEYPWLFSAPEFADTPIYADLRHEQDVLFAAEVLADIDELPEVAR